MIVDPSKSCEAGLVWEVDEKLNGSSQGLLKLMVVVAVADGKVGSVARGKLENSAVSTIVLVSPIRAVLSELAVNT